MDNLAVFNWSGGKDSTLALHYILADKVFKIHCLLTTINEKYGRIAMHGVREVLLVAQVEMLQLQLYKVWLPEMPDMDAYENVMSFHFNQLKDEGVKHAVFGDIFLEDLKMYREKQFQEMGLKTVFPLWKRDSKAIVKEFIALGYKTIVVCAQDGLQHFCGRVIDEGFLDELPSGIDPCGENGEFHTFVFDGPLFKGPVNFTLGDLVFKKISESDQAELTTGYWYIDLKPID